MIGTGRASQPSTICRAVAASNGDDNHRRALDAVNVVDVIKTIHADRESKQEGLGESTLQRNDVPVG